MKDSDTDVAHQARLVWRLGIGVALGTFLLGLPRFAHTTPDSVYYTDLVAYFDGALPRDALHSPYAFRWVVPWLASCLDFMTPSIAIAAISLCATIAAYLVLLHCWAPLLTHPWQLRTAALLLVLSFPTINYSSAVMTDAAGFLILALACHALSRERYGWLALVLVVGTGVRESTLLILPALWIYGILRMSTRGYVYAAALTVLGLGMVWLTRAWFSDLPPYHWMPTGPRIIANLSRPVSWVTLVLSLAPLGMGMFRRGPVLLPTELRALVLAFALPAAALLVFSITAAHMSGRFAWPLYLSLIPVIAWHWTGPKRY